LSLSVRYITAIVALVITACVLVSGAVLFGQIASTAVIIQDNGELTAALLAELAEDGPDAALTRAVEGKGNGVYAAALYDADFKMIASRTNASTPAQLPSGEQLREVARLSESAGSPEAVITDKSMVAMTSVNLPRIKWAVVLLSTATAIDSLGSTIKYALLMTAIFAGIAAGIAAFIARRITKPVQALGRATVALETGSFDPATLKKVTKRKDDLGSLARRFTDMAQEVQDREHRLAAQVEALQVEINQSDRQRSVDSITNSASFADLEQRAARLRARRVKQEKP